MKTSLCLIPLLLFIGVGFCFAQNKHTLEVNYLADNLNTPGISLGYGYQFSSKEKKRKNGKLVYKSFELGMRYAWYQRKKHHTGHLFTPFIRYNRLGKKNIIFQLETGLGYFLRKQIGTTYEVINNELVDSNTTFHRSFSFFGIGLGYDFNKALAIPLQLQIRPKFAFESPNNASNLLHLQSEIGLRYFIK